MNTKVAVVGQFNNKYGYIVFHFSKTVRAGPPPHYFIEIMLNHDNDKFMTNNQTG